MIRILFFWSCLLFCAAGSGCNSHDDHAHTSEEAHEHEHEGTAVTLWTDKTELFMEYPALVVGKEAAFAVHLSAMKNFKAITAGRLTCVFSGPIDDNLTVVAEAPSHPGIFRPVVTFAAGGVYDLELRLEGPQVTDVILVPNVRVYADVSKIPHPEETAGSEELITFLKEQQWRIDFRTEPVQPRKLSGSVQAVGEILARAQGHAEVPAPVAGVILADQNANIPSIGAKVKKGAVLAVISPSANAEAGLINIRNEFLLAKAEFERAQRLFEKQAISQKRLEEAKLRFEARQAGYDVIARQVDFDTAADNEAPTAHFHLTAPIDGVIEEIHFHLGQTVQPGDKLFTVTNSQRVWLKANIPPTQIARIQAAGGASFKVEGYEQEFTVEQLNGRLISAGSQVDEKSRTVPIIFEVDNSDSRFKIGMFAAVAVQTGEAVETLSIPTAAIFDDNGTPVAYVHVEGEAFSKRALQTGISDRGFTQILSGAAEGERVVTVGGYQVRLASLSTSVPVGHGHEH